jgi:hypothetical protein
VSVHVDAQLHRLHHRHPGVSFLVKGLPQKLAKILPISTKMQYFMLYICIRLGVRDYDHRNNHDSKIQSDDRAPLQQFRYNATKSSLVRLDNKNILLYML